MRQLIGVTVVLRKRKRVKTKKETNWIFFVCLFVFGFVLWVSLALVKREGCFIHEDKEKCTLMHHKTKESMGNVEVSMHVNIG